MTHKHPASLRAVPDLYQTGPPPHGATESVSIDLARSHVARLIATYRESVGALQRLMFAQATSAALAVLAEKTVERAASSGDEDAIDRAIAATAAAHRAVEHEDRCVGAWGCQQAEADVLIAEARSELLDSPFGDEFALPDFLSVTDYADPPA